MPERVTAGELLARFPDDPYLRLSADRSPDAAAWIEANSFVTVRTASHGGADLTAIGEPAGIVTLITALLDDRELPPVRSVTASYAARGELRRLLRLRETGGDWDWMWTDDAPPSLPAEARIELLDDRADAAELIELTARGNPDSHGRPGEGRAEYWGGIRDPDGRLMAMGGVVRTAGGYGMLAGIAVDPAHRGHGWGAAITSALTRRELARGGPAGPGCTLGVFISNTRAIALYQRLGYRLGHRFASRTVVAADG